MFSAKVLFENSGSEIHSLSIGHGLCMLIEGGSEPFLFDVGPDGRFLENAILLNARLERVHTVVLSHAHYDHAGGLQALCAKEHPSHLVTGNGFFEEKYAKNGDVFTYLGCGFDESFTQKQGLEHITTNGKMELFPDIWAISGFPRLYPDDEPIPSRFVKGSPASWQTDSFTDELMLAFIHGNEASFLVGCAHPGIVSMVTYAENLLGVKAKAVYGGIHLGQAEDARIYWTLERLQDLGVEKLGLFHCSGSRVSELASMMPSFAVSHIAEGDCFLL